MPAIRYVLARSGEALPFRGRMFAKDGEVMESEDAFTLRLLAEGCIKAVPDPVAPDLDRMSKDELLAEAERLGFGVTAQDTKAEIIAAIKGGH